mmetsp:Transcript_32610/g.77358  ORF Transcript_32610/g.77358 Transcript_32610/m.77358 type:complete len:209 (-) Transcript_32610:304-930(-)
MQHLCAGTLRLRHRAVRHSVGHRRECLLWKEKLRLARRTLLPQVGEYIDDGGVRGVYRPRVAGDDPLAVEHRGGDSRQGGCLRPVHGAPDRGVGAVSLRIHPLLDHELPSLEVCHAPISVLLQGDQASAGNPDAGAVRGRDIPPPSRGCQCRHRRDVVGGRRAVDRSDRSHLLLRVLPHRVCPRGATPPRLVPAAEAFVGVPVGEGRG